MSTENNFLIAGLYRSSLVARRLTRDMLTTSKDMSSALYLA